MDLPGRVRQFVRRHELAGEGTRVVAAVSGGSDSVALVHLLHDLHATGDLRLVGVAHLNHQLREAAPDDEAFSVEVARSLALAADVERIDVAARAAAERRSIEDAAHAARHEFFERARSRFGADCVAVGHTRDDQAETVLLRLIRGAGPRGLGGMYPKRAMIIRPLLDCRRSELCEYLAARKVSYVTDESNADLHITRNRVRAELLPLIEARFNCSVVDVLADQAVLARDAWEWMKRDADRMLAAARRRGSPDVGAVTEIDLETLRDAPRALIRTVLWRALAGSAPGKSIGFEHVDAVLRLAIESRDGRVDVPGQIVERIRNRLVLTGRPSGTRGRWSRAGSKPFWYPLAIPGEVRLNEADCIVSAQTWTDARHSTDDENFCAGRAGQAVIVRSDRCHAPLAVRNRRQGDRFRPVGMAGRKKLQDFFVDRKVPRSERDAVPLVVNEFDQIVWVAGYGIDEAFQVTDPAQGMLVLSVTLLGGPS